MSIEAQKYIQKEAWTKFPAQELWINQNNLFWAWEKEGSNIFLTDGVYSNGQITFETTLTTPENTDQFISDKIETMVNKGYTCFAMEMFSN